MACVPRDIKGKKSAVGKMLSKHKRGTHYSLFSSDGSLNFHLFNDSAPFLVAENDCDARSMGTVNAQINDKKKGIYHGRRTYEANEA